jgi:hypothetical protein
MGTGGCVIIKRQGKETKTRYVTHDGYPAGFGARIAQYLVSNNVPRLFEWMSDNTNGQDYKCTDECHTYVVDLDAETVVVTEREEDEYVRRTLTYDEFSAWCEERY